MTTVDGNHPSAFAPTLPLRRIHTGCSRNQNPLQTCQRLPQARAPTHIHRRQTFARISNGLPAYRAALLTRRDDDTTAVATASRSGTITKPPSTALPKVEHKRIVRRVPDPNPRYSVRMAEEKELYTVADIRCEAFYGYPKDPYYYPVRRREIYMAMRDRIDSGNKCLVVVDKEPPEDWNAFTHNGELVVGSLDVSLHKASSGRRCKFGSGKENVSWEKGEEQSGTRIYLSSMAVREDWQGRGLAQRLLAQVDVLASMHEIEETFLHVEWENAPAVHAYTKCGFVCVEEEEDSSRVPRWLHFLAKREHTLMRRRLE